MSSREFLNKIIAFESIEQGLPDEVLEFLRRHRVVAVGETHGSYEIPALVARVAQKLAQSDSKICIALEILDTNQPELDAYLVTRDDGILERIPHFANRSEDGRSSVAMMNLIKSIATIDNIKICAFDADASTWESPDDQGRASAMARNLHRFIKQNPEYRMLVLCGNVHSSNSLGSFFDTNFRPMMYELGRKYSETVVAADIHSVFVDFESGQTWSTSADGSAPTTWTARETTVPEANGQHCYFASFEHKKFYGHDSILYTKTLSASPPVQRQG